MPALYRWMKTYLMACWECLSSSKHHWSLDRTFSLSGDALTNSITSASHLCFTFSPNTSDAAQIFGELIIVCRNLPSEQRLPSTVLSCFHGLPVHGNSHLYLFRAGAPKMMASIQNDRKVGGGGTIGATCGWQSLWHCPGRVIPKSAVQYVEQYAIPSRSLGLVSWWHRKFILCYSLFFSILLFSILV